MEPAKARPKQAAAAPVVRPTHATLLTTLLSPAKRTSGCAWRAYRPERLGRTVQANDRHC
eukprot:2305400-Prymnesium_polylepis.1